MQAISLALVLLSVFVGETLGECTATSKTYGAGEFSLTRRKWSCINTDSLVVPVMCTGTCNSSTKYTFVPGRRPKPERECNMCKFTTVRVAMNVNCTKTGTGTVKVMKRNVRLPNGCACNSCRKTKEQREKLRALRKQHQAKRKAERAQQQAKRKA